MGKRHHVGNRRANNLASLIPCRPWRFMAAPPCSAPQGDLHGQLSPDFVSAVDLVLACQSRFNFWIQHVTGCLARAQRNAGFRCCPA